VEVNLKKIDFHVLVMIQSHAIFAIYWYIIESGTYYQKVCQQLNKVENKHMGKG
jgi:hypothetical protein